MNENSANYSIKVLWKYPHSILSLANIFYFQRCKNMEIQTTPAVLYVFAETHEHLAVFHSFKEYNWRYLGCFPYLFAGCWCGVYYGFTEKICWIPCSLHLWLLNSNSACCRNSTILQRYRYRDGRKQYPESAAWFCINSKVYIIDHAAYSQHLTN